MKIQNIHITNFLGIQALRLTLDRPVQVFCGPNGAGKSSIMDAVALALQADLGRVTQKKESGQLVRCGADHAEVALDLDGGSLSYNVVISSKGQIRDASSEGAATHSALPYVLRAQRFAGLAPTERRGFLFGLMGLEASGPEICKLLTERGHPEKLLDIIAPLLRTGFDAACKEAQARARDAKTSWRTLTGETYGDKKAATWAAAAPQTPSPEALAHLHQSLQALDAEMAALQQSKGALQATARQEAATAQQAENLRQKAATMGRLEEKLTRETEELAAWKAKLADTRQRASGTRKTGLVHELALALHEALGIAMPMGSMDLQQRAVLADANRLLDAYRAEHGPLIDRASAAPDPDAQALLPEYEQATSLMQRATANTQRDLNEARAAQAQLNTLPAHSTEQQAKTQKNLQEAQQAADHIKVQIDRIRASINAHKAAEHAAQSASNTTAKAKVAHDMVQAWSKLADDLSPDGIPAEMLAKTLGPINARLKQSALMTQWLHAHVEPDMSVWASYQNEPPQPYELLSESEKWRTDAMLAEAIAHFSGLRLLLLDRMDVLDLPGRADLVSWLDDLADKGEIETALVCATLKTLPAELPPTITAHWVEDGQLTASSHPANAGQMLQAA